MFKRAATGKVNTQQQMYNDELNKVVKEIYWGNVFNSAIAGSTWFEKVPLNVGRWAGNYSLFYVLYRILNEIKPKNILELGLGETTKMIQAYKQFHNKDAFCMTIEQDESWIKRRLDNGISNKLLNIIKSDVYNIKIKNYETLVYKNLSEELSKAGNKFNLVLIDGPWGSPNYSRYNIIGLVEDGLIDDDFIIIMDDSSRQGEQETINDLKAKLMQKNYEIVVGSYCGEKSQIVIASNKYKYLESL